MGNVEWYNAQLSAAGYKNQDSHRQSVRTAVSLLLATLDQQNHTTETLSETVELFSKLSRGIEIADVRADSPDATWIPFLLGDVVPGTTVRVRTDAYVGRAGAEHNGRVGTFGSARNREAIVYYRAGDSEGAGHHHDPDKLEVLK